MGLMGGGEAMRGGVARNWTEMLLRVFADDTGGLTASFCACATGCNCSSLPSTRMGMMRSLGAAESDVALTAILISDFCNGFASTCDASAAAALISPGPLEKRFVDEALVLLAVALVATPVVPVAVTEAEEVVAVLLAAAALE